MVEKKELYLARSEKKNERKPSYLQDPVEVPSHLMKL